MLAMLTSDLRTVGQVGSIVCIGLLLDTLIVRSFVVPCILQNPRTVVLVADTRACPSATAAMVAPAKRSRNINYGDAFRRVVCVV